MEEAAFDREQFARDNIGLVYDFMNRHNLRYREDEIVDILYVGYVKALNIWDPKKGAFSSVANACMEKEFISYIKYLGRDMRSSDRGVISLNTLVGEGLSEELIDFIPDKSVNVENQATNSLTLKYLYLAALEVLNAKQLNIFVDIWIYDRPKTEIAKRYNVTKQEIDNIKNHIINKLKNYFENNKTTFKQENTVIGLIADIFNRR